MLPSLSVPAFKVTESAVDPLTPETVIPEPLLTTLNREPPLPSFINTVPVENSIAASDAVKIGFVPVNLIVSPVFAL